MFGLTYFNLSTDMNTNDYDNVWESLEKQLMKTIYNLYENNLTLFNFFLCENNYYKQLHA